MGTAVHYTYKEGSARAARPMFPARITQHSIRRVLTVGFTLVIALLLAAGFFGLRNIRAIQDNAARLVNEQLVSARLIDEIQRQQDTLSVVFYTLAPDPDSVDSERVLAQLDDAARIIERVVASMASSEEAPLWKELKRASDAFAAEARRLLALPEPPTLSSRELLRRHEEVLAVVAKLVEASYQKANEAESQINARSRGLIRDSLLLIGACLVLAIVCATFTVRVSSQLFREMEWQAGELSRVSWHMLENQESAARRFSHELHDELGQSLTAIKANLMGLGAVLDANPAGRRRLEDCVKLVDEATSNVRELSQLLRPTILDDFGLDASLRWLCDGFRERTGITVRYESDLGGRLPEETETHLFRIAQEALTNVARHSGAGEVEVRLQASGDCVTLAVADNGCGLASPQGPQQGLGMIGMRARARSAGGELSVHSAAGAGVRIEVQVPARVVRDAKENPNLVSR